MNEEREGAVESQACSKGKKAIEADGKPAGEFLARKVSDGETGGGKELQE